MVNGHKTPIVDTSIGIVMRLNSYWIQADQFCSESEFRAWNNILDIIFRTLNYEDQVEQIRDEKTDEFIEVKFRDKEKENNNYFSTKINSANLFYNKAIKEYKGFRDDDYPENLSFEDRERGIRNKKVFLKTQVIKGKRLLREALEQKDMWLRKYMHRLGLYLKTYDSQTSNALFGGSGKGGKYNE